LQQSKRQFRSQRGGGDRKAKGGGAVEKSDKGRTNGGRKGKKKNRGEQDNGRGKVREKNDNKKMLKQRGKVITGN